jgi:hypothetical protein
MPGFKYHFVAAVEHVLQAIAQTVGIDWAVLHLEHHAVRCGTYRLGLCDFRVRKRNEYWLTCFQSSNGTVQASYFGGHRFPLLVGPSGTREQVRCPVWPGRSTLIIAAAALNHGLALVSLSCWQP